LPRKIAKISKQKTMQDIMQLCEIRKYALSQASDDRPLGALASVVAPLISLFAPFRG
jgi:hypothetical protein